MIAFRFVFVFLGTCMWLNSFLCFILEDALRTVADWQHPRLPSWWRITHGAKRIMGQVSLSNLSPCSSAARSPASGLNIWTNLNTQHTYTLYKSRIILNKLFITLFLNLVYHRYSFCVIEGKNKLLSNTYMFISSVAQSCQTLQPHGLQHARLLCPPLCPGICSDSCPLSQWCCLTICFSATPFCFCLQPFPPSGSLPMSWLCIRWPKYWSFSFSISPSNEYSGLLSFGMDGLDLLAVQGALKSLLQHHSSKASILRRSVFFMVQLISIHDYWKNHSLD